VKTAFRSFALLAWIVPLHLAGGAIFDDLGSASTFSGSSWLISNGSTFFGTTFVTTAGGTLANIRLPIFSSAALTMGLYANSSGEPGTLLESWTRALPNDGSTITTLTSVAQPVLLSGTQYWFVVNPSGGPSWSWGQNNQAVTGGNWTGSSVNALAQSGNTFAAPAIQLNSAAVASGVPEPGSGMMITLGCVALAVRGVCRYLGAGICRIGG
jgi:hypothetical protein